MPQSLNNNRPFDRRYALCVGIGTYTNPSIRNLRYATADATTIAGRLADPRRGNFAVTLLTELAQTTKEALEKAIGELLCGPDRQSEDLTVIYFSCHGDVNDVDNTFCLWPSNAILKDASTLIGIRDLARWFENARTQNVIVFLDVCHSGGAGAALQHFTLKLETGPNFFFIGAARQDQVARESSQLHHGLFTHSLLRAFEQPPISDGWLTISQIHAFVSEEIPLFTQEEPIQIQSWLVSVNPNLPLLRNPGYPELSPLPPLWNVPFSRNGFFTGQEDLLARLATTLEQEQKTVLTQPHVLTGLGGIGKTQLAVEYAYRHRQDYHAVFWGGADTVEALVSTFVAIAEMLNLPQKDKSDQTEIVDAVKAWLSKHSQWLLVLDNADDLAIVQGFLPPVLRGHLLLTTRAQTVGKVVGNKIEVEVMQPETGALLLLRRARIVAPKSSLQEAPDKDVAKAKELVEELGGLPLALDQAGAYIEEMQCSLEDYHQLYKERREVLLAHKGKLDRDYPASVTTTWSLSFMKVEVVNPIAADLLRACAFLAPDVIAQEIIVQGATHLGSFLAPMATEALLFDQAIGALRSYSLVKRDPGEGTVSVHRLVQAVMRDAMSQLDRQCWAERVVRAVYSVIPPVEHTHWLRWERLLPHVQICAQLIREYELVFPETTQLLMKSGEYFVTRAQYLQAEPLLKQAVAMSEQMQGANHQDTAECLDRLAWLYRRQGKYEEARQLFQRSLSIREQVLGAAHAETAQSFSNLAHLSLDQKNFKEAERLFQQSLIIREQVLGPAHLDTAQSFHYLGATYNEQGKHEAAKPFFEKSLAIREQVLGSMHPEIGADLLGLGWIHGKQRRYKEAEQLFQRAIQVNEQALGSAHPHTAKSYDSLGWVYWRLGQYTEAESLLQQALVSREQIFGSTPHPNTALNLLFLALVYQDQGRYTDALSLCQQAIDIYEKVPGLGVLDMAKALVVRAKLLFKERQIVQAMKSGIQALKIMGPSVLVRYAVENIRALIR